MSIRSLKAEQKRLEAAMAKVNKALDEAKARTMVKCSHCGKGTVVSALTYIQTHWYVEPYGCTGGDRWRKGHGEYDCPKCGKRNRLYERPEVEALKRYFKKVKEEHDRR